ncbi:6-phosphofructokinase [Mycobacterium sp. HUMS_1102779]|uniref:6-phosphofructokinase n=1 Tax=Mycobacterium sp. HUMS_1102779 TaxID=3383487 RepID=UPI003899C73B
MTSTELDLSSGLPADREQTVRACPEVPGWTENLLFTSYDPVNDIGMWLHLGTVADMWEMWEDRVLIALPEDQGVLSMWAYHRTVPDHQPAGSNLAFRCERPFTKWRITFDGFCVKSSYQAMRTGLLTDGPKAHVQLDLKVQGLTPVWDAESGPAIASGAGMAEQSWAREHYEQLTRVTGEVRIDGEPIRFGGGGWRDHSRGPRGADTLTDWGGHVIVGGVMPSGRAFGLCRYWARDGRITLEGAYVVEDGALRHVQVDEIPSPAELSRDGEQFTVAFDGGAPLTATVRSSLWLSMADGLPYGVLEPARAYTVSWAEVTWGDETGHVYIERSNLSGR